MISKILPALAALTLAAASTGVASPQAASAATCYVSALHNGAGAGSYTLNITADPCGLPVNATALCAYFIGGKHWHHGPVIHGRGSSVAQCGLGVANISAWGYDVVYQGHTNYIQLGNI